MRCAAGTAYCTVQGTTGDMAAASFSASRTSTATHWTGDGNAQRTACDMATGIVHGLAHVYCNAQCTGDAW